MQQATREFNGQTVTVDFTRGGSSQSAEVALRSDETKKENEGYLGASLNQRESYRATWSAPVVGVGLTVQLTGLTFQGLGDTVVNLASGIAGKFAGNSTQADANLEKAGQGVAGPVGLLGVILPQLIKAGFDYVLLVMAIISLSLAALNVLPIPALDGGRWFMTAIARLFKRPLSPEKEELINGIGFMFLMALFVIITIADVGKILR
jgi:regulator of sigma E protease